MILRRGRIGLHLLNDHMGRAVPYLPAGHMSVFNGNDGVIRVTAQIVHHYFTAAAELSGDARGHLFE